MAAHVLGAAEVDRNLGEIILRKTEGVPFFIEEFIKALKDLKIIEWKEKKCCLAKEMQTVAIPSTIQSLIMARVDALPEAAKEVLQIGSAIGKRLKQINIMVRPGSWREIMPLFRTFVGKDGIYQTPEIIWGGL